MTTVTLYSEGQDKLHCSQRDMATVTLYTKGHDNSYVVHKRIGQQLHCTQRVWTTVILYTKGHDNPKRQDNRYTVLRDMTTVTLLKETWQ